MKLTREIQRWTGNHASIAEAAASEIDRLRTDDRAIVDELRSDGIVLGGAGLARLLQNT